MSHRDVQHLGTLTVMLMACLVGTFASRFGERFFWCIIMPLWLLFCWWVSHSL